MEIGAACDAAVNQHGGFVEPFISNTTFDQPPNHWGSLVAAERACEWAPIARLRWPICSLFWHNNHWHASLLRMPQARRAGCGSP